MKGKSVFTKQEADEIIALIRQKVLAAQPEQKRLRDKIRKIGFYASDFGIGGGYDEKDFLSVVEIEGTGSSKVADMTVNAVKVRSLREKAKRTSAPKDKDEVYIIDLCDEVFRIKAIRQHRFSFLLGDANTPLPVDAWYPSLNLVVEYREKQHTEAVAIFDRRQTVSGTSRGEQRKLYDQRRRDVLPEHGIRLVEFNYSDFEHGSSKRLKRVMEKDLEVVRKMIANSF